MTEEKIQYCGCWVVDYARQVAGPHHDPGCDFYQPTAIEIITTDGTGPKVLP